MDSKNRPLNQSNPYPDSAELLEGLDSLFGWDSSSPEGPPALVDLPEPEGALPDPPVSPSSLLEDLLSSPPLSELPAFDEPEPTALFHEANPPTDLPAFEEPELPALTQLEVPQSPSLPMPPSLEESVTPTGLEETPEEAANLPLELPTFSFETDLPDPVDVPETPARIHQPDDTAGFLPSHPSTRDEGSRKETTSTGLSRGEEAPVDSAAGGATELQSAWLDDLLRQAADDSEQEILQEKGPADEEQGEKYLVFTLAGSEYTTRLRPVVQIDYVPRITPLPHLPDWLLGMCNLRGEMLSLVDLRMFLGVEESPLNRTSRLLVVQGGEDRLTVGLIVDRVRELCRLTPEQITPGGEDGNVPVPFQEGVARQGSRSLRVLDLDKLLGSVELRQFQPNFSSDRCEE